MQESKADFAFIDLESLLGDVNDAELYEIERLLRSASKTAQENPELEAARAYACLSAAANLNLTPEKPDEPFGAMLIMENGRSSIPDDFWGEPLAALEEVAKEIANTPLKTRLCDLVWLLNRSNHECGQEAVNSYYELVVAFRD